MSSIIDICCLKWKTKRYTFSLFFGCRVKIPYLQFLFFLSVINIFKTRSFQMLFKIGTLNIYAILQLCKTVCCFPVKIAKFLRTDFLKAFSVGCFSIIFKLIKQLFRNGVNINKFLNKFIYLLWRPSNVFPQHVLQTPIVWCIKSKTFFFTKFVVNFQVF